MIEMNSDFLREVGVTLLTPENTHIFIGRLGSVHCIVNKEDAYANVHCLLTFPIHFPNRYISVCHTDDEGKEQEIGVIVEPTEFPAAAQEIIRKSLMQHYFEQHILRIYEIRLEFGLLFFDVETNNGRRSFSMRWQQGKALEYGKTGKVLIDTFENRYVIPNLKALPGADYNRLVRFIYW